LGSFPAIYERNYDPIVGPGMFILGQEADSLGGGYDSDESFSGRISEFNVWSYPLEADTINDLYKCQTNLVGDVINWTHPLTDNGWVMNKVDIEMV
jgi:hypothetical protein